MKNTSGPPRRGSGRCAYIALLVALIASGPTGVFAASGFEESARILVGGDEDYQFSIAAEGNRVLLGNTGLRQARIYDARTGALEQVLECPAVDPEGGREYCGVSVAMTRRHVALGAVAVFVFDRAGRVVTRVDLPVPEQARSLALRGNRLVVGTGTGSVYLYHARTGALLRKYTHPDAAPGEQFDPVRAFGQAVVRIGHILVVAAPGCGGDPDCPPGEVLAFDVDDGSLRWRTRAPASSSQDGFGLRLARIGRDVVAGSRSLSTLHRLDGRTGAPEATYAVPGIDRPLGGALAAHGDTVVVGDMRTGGESGGAVHVFAARHGDYLGSVTPVPELSGGPLGSAVALVRRHLAVTSDAYSGLGMLLLYQPRKR